MSLKKHIPNLITSLNIACGIVGVVFAFRLRSDVAFALMLAAGVFDFLDGFAARTLGAYSPVGRELDSLCDVVSFGVLPSIMLHNASLTCMMSESWVCWTPLLIAVFSALRLAKFNLDERQTMSFIGLPTPACAMICGSLCCYAAFEPESFLCAWIAGPVFVPVLSAVLCALLVCPLPMFSLKFSRQDSSTLVRKRVFLAVNCLLCLAIVLIAGQHISLAVLLSMTVYVAMNLVFALFKI